ncbi:MAG: T9SS type A sorting domain-containing protein [Flavobacteriales bacterium]
MRSLASLLLPALLSGVPALAQNDIENVLVETYYISDSNDATDTIGGTLTAGSRTYRVFIDLCDSCALRAIYGDVNHPLIISSTAPFFNNLDRGKSFGHEISNSALDENTVALDSWLSMGAASNQRFGVLKVEDTDGSIVGGSNNDGGSAMIPNGLVANEDPDAGVPITTQDGLIPLGGGAVIPPNFNVQGLSPATVFADSTLGSVLYSIDTRMGCSTPGVVGPTPENKILIAQFTTAGELSFCLNVEVEKPDGSVIHYVASDSVLLAGETASGLLCYPPMCGCTDPNFLEYDATAGCDDGSCQTLIVFGCLDPLACNYDPSANFNVVELCCYGPDNCNGLDVSLVCPGVGVSEERIDGPAIEVFPNPADDRLFIRAPSRSSDKARVVMRDPAGRVVVDQELTGGAINGAFELDLSTLASGIYLLHVRIAEERYDSKIVVN